MNWAEICAVVVPCRNEQDDIERLVLEVQRQLPTVIVVDDNSSDQTAACATSAGARVIRRERKPGKGAALKVGLAAALGEGCGWAITLDGDGQHRPSDISQFLRRADDTGAALIVGNRMHRAERIPWLRRFVNRWMSRRISELVGRPIPDSQCGFRLINLNAWRSLRLETDHFEVESEMLVSLIRAGYPVEFVPIVVIGRARRSHIHPVMDAWRWFRWWTRARTQRSGIAPVPGRSNSRPRRPTLALRRVFAARVGASRDGPTPAR